MERLHCVVRAVAFAVSASCSLLGTATPAPRIAPLQAVLHFSAKTSARAVSVPIKDTRGVTVYVLTLAKEADVDPSPFELELFLRRAHDGADGWNFFYKPGTNWHGIQPWFFPADDFAHGVANPKLYGPHRVFDLPWIGIVLQTEVIKADVIQSGSDSGYDFTSLDLLVRVHAKQP
jgi:hypothetical protein